MRIADMRRVVPLLFAAVLLSPAVATRGAETEEGWPRNFVNADGSTTVIPGKPQRIFSTSVSATGTRLAIDAPVVASGSAGNGTFFAQWAALARQQGCGLYRRSASRQSSVGQERTGLRARCQFVPHRRLQRP